MTTRVKMLTTAAGPTGNLIAGQVYSLPDKEAAELVAGRYAVPVAPENAAARPAPAAAERSRPAAEAASVETAAAKPQRGGRGGGKKG